VLEVTYPDDIPAGRRRISAGPLRDFGTVDARGRHLDQDFASRWHRHRAGLGQKAPPGRRA